MADNNNSIRGSYPSGTPLDISAIVSVLSDIKGSFNNINNILQQLQNTMKPGSSSRDAITPRNLENLFKRYVDTGATNRNVPSNSKLIRSINGTVKSLMDLDSEISKYDKDLKHLNSSNLVNRLQLQVDHFVDEMDKTVHNVAGTNSDLVKLSDQLATSSKALNSTQNQITKFNLIQQQTNKKLQDLVSKETSIRNELTKDLDQQTRISLQQSLQQVEQKRKELESDRDIYDQKIDTELQHLEEERQRNEKLAQQYETTKKHQERLNELEKDKIESTREILSISSNLSSKTAQLLPESVKQWETYKKSIGTFFNPQESDEFQSYMEEYTEALNKIQLKRDDNSALTSDLQYNLDIETKNNEELKELLKEAEVLGNTTQTEEIKAQIEESNRQIEVYNLELDKIERENELLDAQEEQVKEEAEQVEQNFTFTKNFLGTVGKGIENLTKSMLDRLMGQMIDKADTVFDSFEDLQRSIGRTLKMDAGAYDAFAEQMADIAHEAGLAVDVTQLNEAAANMVDLGVRDESLIQGLALGQAYIAESGSSVKLDEETIKQLQAQYFQSVEESMAEGATEQEAKQQASGQVTSMIQQLIAAEQWVADTYGSTSALASGGSEAIQSYLNKVFPTGMAPEQYAEFFGQMASSMQAMEKLGLDSSTIMSDLDSLMENPMSELSTDIKSWLGNNNLGISSTQDLYAALQSGQGGDIMTSLAQWKANLLGDMDATSVSYAKGIYGMNETLSQAIALQKQGETASTSYVTPETEDISNTWDYIEKGIEKGDYLSATEKLEKTEIDKMTDVGRIAQQVADGKFWMDQGLNSLQTIINSAAAFLLSGMGSMFGGLGGAGTGGTGIAGGALKDFVTGNTDTLAGKIGTYGTMGVGGAMSAISMISNIKQADSVSEGIINGFRDSTFTSGLGTVIGGAIGGPIGGAIGGALGKAVPALSEGLENILTSFIDDNMEYEEERIRKNAEQMEKAAQALESAAGSHKQAANELESNMEAQKATFDTMTEQEKQDFIAKSGLTEQEKENLLKSGDNNALFEAAIKKWEEEQMRQIEMENLLSEGAELAQGSLAGIGVDDVSNYTKKQIKGMSDNELIAAGLSAGMSEDDARSLIAMSSSDAMKALNAAEEHKANLSTFMSEQGGEQSFMANVQKYAELKGIKDLGAAAKQYVQEVSPDLYSDKQLDEIASLVGDYGSLENQYNEANNEFHTKINNLLKRSGGTITTYDDFVNAYRSSYLNLDWSGIQGSDIVDGHYVIDGNDKFDASKLPDLRYKHNNANIGYDYDPDLYMGKYRTGLNYVPMDDYIALLHQGEMVLNESEANYYRNNLRNPVSTRSLSSMSDEKADRIIEILNKMLQVMISRTTSGRSNLPKSLVQMNSNISVY